jgi:hypothetical protein
MSCTIKNIPVSGIFVTVGNNGSEYILEKDCKLPVTNAPELTSESISVFSTENNFLFQTEEGFCIEGVGLMPEDSFTLTGTFSAWTTEDGYSFFMENGQESFVSEINL